MDEHFGTSRSAHTNEALIWAGLAVSVLAFLVWPAVAVAYALRRLFGGSLTRSQWSVIGLAGLLASVSAAGTTVLAVGRWVLAVTPLVDQSLWPLPLFAISVLSATFAGLAALLGGSRLGGAVAGRVSSTINLPGLHRGIEDLEPSDIDSALPSAMERAELIATKGANTDGIVGQPAVALEDLDRVGKRPFSFALDRNGLPFQVSEEEISMHVGLVGATGSGKTVTIQSYVAALCDMNYSALVVDLKEATGAGDLRDFLSSYASAHGVPFQEIALGDPDPEYWFNPLAGMTQDAMRDTILALQEFDDGHWQAVNKRMLGQLLDLCIRVHALDPGTYEAPTMYGLGKILGSADIARDTKDMRALLARHMAEDYDADAYSSLSRPTQDEQKSRTGLAARITAMFESQAGRTILRPGICQRTGNARREIDVTADGIVYIGADSTSKLDLAKMLSSSVLARISAYVADRTTGLVQPDKKPRVVVVDEASVVDRTLMHGLVSKGRSAGVSTLWATQSPTDWIDRRSDDWSKLSQNLNMMMVMVQNNDESAELCARYLGSERVTQSSIMVRDGEAVSANLRDSVDYLFSAEDIRGLSKGEAIIRISNPDVRVKWTSIQLRNPTAHARVAEAPTPRRGLPRFGG